MPESEMSVQHCERCGGAIAPPQQERRHCVKCGFGWKPLNQHQQCPDCARAR